MEKRELTEELLENSPEVKEMENEAAKLQKSFYDKYKSVVDYEDLEELVTNVMLVGLETGFKIKNAA